MPFDLKGAIEKGGTYSGVAEYLAARMPDFDLKGARETSIQKGRTQEEADKEIAEYLSSFDKEASIGSPIPKQQPKWAKEHPTLGKIFDTVRTGMEQVGRPALETAGMEGGKLAALPTTVALSKTPGGMAALPAVTAGLETLGFGAGATLSDLIESGLSQLDEGIKKPLPGLRDVGKNLAMGSAIATGVPIVGKVGGKFIDKVGAPFKNRITPESDRFLKEATELDVIPTAADVTQSKGLSLFGERMPDISFMATDIAKDTTLKNQIEPFMRARQTLIDLQGPREEIERLGHEIYNQVDDFLKTKRGLQGDTLNDMRSAVLAQFGKDMPLSDLGLKGQQLLKAQQHAREAMMHKLYSDVGQHLPQGQFLSPVRKTQAEKIMKEIGDQNFSGLPKELKDEIGLALENNAPMTWENLAFKRSRLNDLIESNKVPGTGKLTSEGRLYNMLYEGVIGDMKNISQQHGGQAQAAFDLANTWAKENFYKFFGQRGKGAEHIRKLMDTNPEKLIEQALHPNGVTDVQTLKNLIGPKTWARDFEPAFVDYLVGPAGPNGVWDPSFLKNQLSRFGKYGEETITQAIGKHKYGVLKELAENGFDVSSKALDMRMLEGFLQKHPGVLVQSLIGSPETKLNSATVEKNLDLLKTVLRPDTFREVVGEFTEKVAELSQISGNMLPQKFSKNFDKYKAVFRKFMDDESFTYAEKMANVGKRLQTADRIAGNPSGTGQTVVTWGQFGLAVRDAYNLTTEGDVPVLSPLVILGPAAVAKLYRTPSAFKWLTKGFEVSAGKKEGAALASRISGILAADELKKEKKPKQFSDPLGLMEANESE